MWFDRVRPFYRGERVIISGRSLVSLAGVCRLRGMIDRYDHLEFIAHCLWGHEDWEMKLMMTLVCWVTIMPLCFHCFECVGVLEWQLGKCGVQITG
jgi:hypothetical protein